MTIKPPSPRVPARVAPPVVRERVQVPARQDQPAASPLVPARRRPAEHPGPSPAPLVGPGLGPKDPRSYGHQIAPGRATPPERIDIAGAHSLDEFSSACPVVEVTAHRRLDPYWDGLWGVGSGASWLSATIARRQTEAGLGRLPTELNLRQEQALEAFESARGWDDRLALLGAMFSWRTMTVEQAAAFVGNASFATALNTSPAVLFASGVLDLGVFSNGLRNTDLTGRGALYRTGKGDVFDAEIKDRLSWAEWLSVTGGQRWSPSSSYDRHNILSTELALRLAEFTSISDGAVLGERFSSLDHLVGSGIGNPSRASSQKAADLCAVRPDGLRIAFEMTANIGTHFYNKVSSWARILAEHPLETSGLCVVFVIIQRPERLSDEGGWIPRARTYQAVAAACKEFPGSVRDRVAERMGVATWREWFPGRGLVHDSFLRLRVDRPTGRGADLWEPADMLVATPTSAEGVQGRPFTPRDPDRVTAVFNNAALLGNTPQWMRGRHEPPVLWPRLLADAGVGRIPMPTPARPNRTKGRALGAASGVAGPAEPPSRLTGLARPPR